MCEIRSFEKKIQSQFGEAGIILEVLRRIGKKGLAVEIGAGFGYGNCYELATQGWRTLFVEIEPSYINQLRSRFGHLSNVSCVNAAINRYNVNSIIPKEVMFLSIDIDSNDYWIWEALNSTPLFVVVEINSAFPPPQKKVMHYDESCFWDGTNYYGGSLSAFYDLGRSKGYVFIGTDSIQLNAYFVHKSVAHLFKEETPESVWYKPDWSHPPSNRKMLDLNEFEMQKINLESLKVYDAGHEKIRLGIDRDGGYVVCNLHGYDCFLSGGVGEDISFETDFLNINKELKCHLFDSSKSVEINNIIFTKKIIGSEESEKETNLNSFLNIYKNIFIKMDIEWGEYNWIKSVSDEQLKNIKQFVVELHSSPKRWDFLSRLTKTHYLVHLHGSNCGGITKEDNVIIPDSIECTYLRKNEIVKLKRNRNKIPTSIDRANTSTRPDIELKGYPYQDTTLCYSNFLI